MLTVLGLSNWKSFGPKVTERGSFTLGPVTLLVGPNASGKSNVIDALRFLQGAALDLPLGDVLRGRWEGQREVWPGIRGHVAEAARQGCDGFFLGSAWNLAQKELNYAFQVGTAGDAQVRGEGLSSDHQELLSTHAEELKGKKGLRPGGAIHVALRGKDPDKQASKIYNSWRSLLGQVVADGDPNISPDVREPITALRQALRQATFLDIRPWLMREYRPESSQQIGTSGENISPILARLAEEPGRLEDVVDWLTELCGPTLEKIEFDRTQLGEVMMFLVEKGGRKISARSMSEGTLRFLGLLAALLTCPEGTLMIMEEPDVGLHPSRIRLLAELFEHVAKERKLQILATTHSPTLLANLSKEALGNVVAFDRDPEEGYTICKRLAELKDFETLAEAKDLEHLISTGWLERAL